jgi:nucleoside-diphosphate-sugar epimerase
MSSVKAMGEPGCEVVAEEHAGNPDDPYGRSKHEAELELLELHGHDLDVVILRPVLVYGPGAKGNFGMLLRFLERGYRPPLPKLANRRSLIGVNDLTSATILAGTTPGVGGRVYTVTDGRVYSTTDIINTLAAAYCITGRPRWNIPIPALRAIARLGDLTQSITGGTIPFNSQIFERLIGNAEYEARALGIATGFAPEQSLEDVTPVMIAAAG